MTVKEYLMQARALKGSVDAKKELLKAVEESISATQNKTLIRNLKYERFKLEQSLNYQMQKIATITKIIEKIEDPALRAILEYKYLCCISMQAIASKLNYSRRHIIRMHSKALEEAEKFYKSA